MTREELKGIVEGITDDQLKRIPDIRSADIGKAIDKANNDFEDVKAKLETAKLYNLVLN